MHGRFFGVYGSYLTGSPWIGMLLGIVAGVLAALILGVMAITVKVNQVVVGAGLNSLCLGLSSYLLTICYPDGVPSKVNGFQYTNIPVLSDIPVLVPFSAAGVNLYCVFASSRNLVHFK